MIGRGTWERIGWWVERGPQVFAIALAMILYAVVIARVEFGLPLEVQLALFESQHGILLIDDPSIPGAAVIASRR